MPRTTTLEPIRPVLVVVSLIHLGIAAFVAWFAWRLPPERSEFPAAEATTPMEAKTTSLLQDHAGHWFDPADFTMPAVTAAAPEPPPTPPAEPAANSPAPDIPAATSARYITLSRLNTAASAGQETSTARHDLTALDRLDEALYEAFMRAWQPPNPRLLAAARRTVRLDVSLGPGVTLEKADLAAPSGSPELDLSVLDAAEKVKEVLRSRPDERRALKFPQSLPSPFQNSRYDCRIQFQVE